MDPSHTNGHLYSQWTRIFPQRKVHKTILSNNCYGTVSLIQFVVISSISLPSSLDNAERLALIAILLVQVAALTAVATGTNAAPPADAAPVVFTDTPQLLNKERVGHF
jgi:hypothetical protein